MTVFSVLLRSMGLAFWQWAATVESSAGFEDQICSLAMTLLQQDGRQIGLGKTRKTGETEGSIALAQTGEVQSVNQMVKDVAEIFGGGDQGSKQFSPFHLISLIN